MQTKTIKTIIESSFVQLCIIFVAAILLKELGIISINDINFMLFAYVLALFSIPAILKVKEVKAGKIPHTLIILIIIFLFVFGVRLIPYAENTVPLGYDPGFYKHAIELYADDLPGIPESELPEWVKEMYPQGLFLLTDELYLFGFDPVILIKIFFPFLCAFMVFPLFMVAREFFDERTALLAVILYALSGTQFHTFFLLYFKNVIALMLMLLAIYVLKKEKYMLLVLLYAALGAYHRPTFLLFTLILVFYLIKNFRNKDKIKNVVLTISAGFILLVPFYLPRMDIYYDILFSSVASPGAGTFVSFQEYEWLSLAYLPFALIGFLYLVIKRNFNLLFLWAAINGSIVLFQLVFYNRFIIPLDLLFIILAAAGLNYVFLNPGKVSRNLGIGVVLLLFASSGIMLFDRVGNTHPLITENQLEAVIWLSNNSEADAYVLATSYDAPWVLGWSKRKVIAPGLFEHNVYGRTEWMKFFGNRDLEETKKFLSPYEGQVYVYNSKNYGNYLGLEKFENECFEKVYDRQAVIYKYLC